jgi:hypothetical protein
MACGVIKQCTAMTKNNCRCKIHVTTDGDLCKFHAKKEVTTPTNAPANVPVSAPVNVYVNFPVSAPANFPVSTPANVPQNIFLNGKFVPNIHNIALPPFKKPSTVVQNWSGVQSCGKTPDEMYNYLFPK